MKINTGLVIVAVLILVAVIIVVAILLSPKNKAKQVVVEGLKSYTWLGLWIDMPGLSCSTREVFGSPLRLTFLTNRTCSLEIRDEVIKARWKLADGSFRLWGKGLDARGYLSQDESSFADSYFSLDLEGYLIIFNSDFSLGETKEES